MQLVRASAEQMARFILNMKESPMGEIRVPVRVSNPFDASRYWEADFLVDTGATVSSVPVDVLNSIGVDASELAEVFMADGRSALRRVGLASIEVASVKRTTEVIYAPEQTEPLLGCLILEAMGFLVDPLKERLRPRSDLSVGVD